MNTNVHEYFKSRIENWRKFEEKQKTDSFYCILFYRDIENLYFYFFKLLMFSGKTNK